MINEREEFEQDKEEQAEAIRRIHQSAVEDVARVAGLSRTFILLAVQPNGDMAYVVHGQAYSDFIAIAQEGGNVINHRIAQFRKKDIGTVQ